MHTRGYFFTIFIAFVAISRVQAGSFNPFANGDFSGPLDVGWTNYSNTNVLADQAVLQEDQDSPTFLEQYFVLPSDVSNLSFQYLAAFDNGVSDSFTVSLLDTFRNPFIDSNPNPSDPSESYFFMHDSVNGLYLDTRYVSTRDIGSGWSQIDFDVSSLAGTSSDAILSFDLVGNFMGPFNSQILLDNIEVHVIPEPSTIFNFIGLLSAGILGKRFRI